MIKAKLEDKMLLVRFIGKSPAALNGFVMKQEEAYEAQEDDVISLVCNSDFQYKVTFQESSENSIRPKRLSEDELESAQKRPKTENDKWGSVDNGKCLVFTSKGIEGREKIAAYDMDNTLIKTVSGNVFPKNVDDWQLNYGNVPKKLKSLHENGFKIVVFTNQGGISSGKQTVEDIKKKVGLIQKRLDVPCQFFIATSGSVFRKPRIGMWKQLEENYNNGVKIDMNQSFYIGDAAGRPEVKITKRKKDHSSADRLLAINLGLDFYTPEEHFLNAKDQPKSWNRPQFDPSKISSAVSLLEPSDAQLTSDVQEIILLVGFPGSGKSFFSHNYLKKAGYEIINRDTLKTQQKCISNLETVIANKRSCVIDSTNPDVESRKRYTSVAKQLKVPIRCFFFTTTYDQAKHNNIFRELTDSTHQKIPEMVFNMYKKNFHEPTKKEGFSEVIRVNFVPKFKDSESETLYKMYLVEK